MSWKWIPGFGLDLALRWTGPELPVWRPGGILRANLIGARLTLTRPMRRPRPQFAVVPLDP